MGYSKQAGRGARWVAAFRGFLRLSAFIRIGILARILSPDQFGMFGIATMALGLVEMFTETGINVFLIQEADEKALETYIDTAWFVSVLRGLVIAILIYVGSPFIAAFFRSPESLTLLRLISLVPLIRGFINPSLVVFQKDLRFHHEFWFRGIIIAVETIVTIVVAYVTRDTISLVIGLIVSVILETFLSHVLLRPLPHLSWNLIKIKKILSRGKWITSAGIFTYFATKAPDAVIGRTSTTASLGLYQIGFRYAVLPIQEVIEVFNRVTFPVYSKIAGDHSRLKRAFYKTFFRIIFISLSIFAIIWLFPTQIVLIALGNQWDMLVPMMRPLSLIGLTLAVSAPINPLLLALKQQKSMSLISLVHMLVLVLCLWPLTQTYGVVGVVYAYIAANIVIIPVRWLLAYRYLS